MRSELQLDSTDIKHSDNVLLERIAKNVQIIRCIVTTIIDTCDTDIISIIVGTGIENHIQWVNDEGGTANGDAVCGGCGIAVNNIGSLIVAVYSGRIKCVVYGIGDGGWVVVESCARVNLAFH